MRDTLGAIIVAAGSGQRMGGLDKLFTPMAGRPLLAHTIAPFVDCPAVSTIVLVMALESVARGQNLATQYGFAKISAVVRGGVRRQDSVRAGLDAIDDCKYVSVHDGGRPLLTVEMIERGLAAARETGAAVPGVRIADTVKETDDAGLVVRTVDRSELWGIQTPQVFRRELLERAHREITSDMTDDAAMVEALGEPVRVFEGDRRNLKVTLADDLAVVRVLLERTLTSKAAK